MIGGIGLMNWLRAWHVSRIGAMTSSTCASSAPARIVACDCFRKPPCECSRVTPNSLSVSASTSAPHPPDARSRPPASSGGDYTPASWSAIADGQVKLVISGDAAQGMAAATLRSPFATRHPSLGRKAQELIDLAADVRGHHVFAAITIYDHEAPRFGCGEPKIPVANTLVERPVVAVKAVPAGSAGSRREAREADLDGDVDKERPLRYEGTNRETGHRTEAVKVCAEAKALIGKRRVEVPVGDHDLPRDESRPDHVTGVLGPRGGEQQCLRLRTEIDLPSVQQHVADALREGRAARFAGEHHRPSSGLEALGESRRLHRFADRLAALKRQE